MLRMLTLCIALALPLAAAAGAMEPVESGRGFDLYRIAFVGGEPARVGVSPAVGSEIDVYVFDAEEQLVCRSGGAKEQSCEWLPGKTSEYWILVSNRRDEDAAYMIWTN